MFVINVTMQGIMYLRSLERILYGAQDIWRLECLLEGTSYFCESHYFMSFGPRIVQRGGLRQ
jgi:hypothetical protein